MVPGGGVTPPSATGIGTKGGQPLGRYPPLSGPRRR